jgi:choline kinase
MEAVIYAAGRATRLGPAFAETPKILLEVGGRSLLAWHIQRLEAVGVDAVTLVTGHGRDLILHELTEISGQHRVQIRESFNPNYFEGSVLSMLVSLPLFEAAREPVLVMDGDVFYDPELLHRLVETEEPSALLVDFGYTVQDDDPVLVPIKDGRPFELVKLWTGTADRVGESVGLFKVAVEHMPLLIRETRVRSQGLLRRDSLDEVLRELARAGCFAGLDITGLPWTEIDYPYDVEYARTEVLSAMEQRLRQRMQK